MRIYHFCSSEGRTSRGYDVYKGVLYLLRGERLGQHRDSAFRLEETHILISTTCFL